ncbi:hypothetical protein [Streptomyces sp. LN549]|uniref:hypothetical protein n=1 Tax=Streptomyces sp. LN549 TaxID=3112979 RepID=UPI0037143585
MRDPVATEQSEAVALPFVPPDGMLDVMGRPRRLVARTAERYAAVQALLADGQPLAAIGRRLRLDHSTVRRFARANSLDELLAKATGRLSVLDEHKPCLHARRLDVCHDIPQLHRELLRPQCGCADLRDPGLTTQWLRYDRMCDGRGHRAAPAAQRTGVAAMTGVSWKSWVSVTRSRWAGSG